MKKMHVVFWCLLGFSFLLVGCGKESPTEVSPAKVDQVELNPAGLPIDPLTDVEARKAVANNDLSLQSTNWVVGDVFAGIAGGRYSVFDNAGTFKETISDGLGGFTTGCSFNPALDKLYTTNFSATKVIVYDDASPHSILQTIDTNIKSPGGHSESIVFAADGSFYVGHPDGNDDIHHYDAAGTFLAQFNAAVIGRGTDWIDLATDQRTMFYTSERSDIRRYDVVADAQLLDFANGIGTVSYALRLLPPGDGTGGLLVANTSNVKRLDGAGAVVQTYDATGENQWFSLNLDPNGTSFWAGSFDTNNFYRFNIASGAIEVGPIASGGSLFGLCVKGEPVAALRTEFLLIDEDAIDNGIQSIGAISFNPPNCGAGDPAGCVNDHIADPGVRAILFSDILGFKGLTLPTGEVGDEGLFMLTAADPQTSLQGTPSFTTAELIAATGAASDENNLDKIVGVVPLGAADIAALEGKTICALVYDSDISTDPGDPSDPSKPPYASLKGATYGLTAFTVTFVGPDPGGSVLPSITVDLELDPTKVCGRL